MAGRLELGTCVVATAVTLIYGIASYYPEDAEVFLFPRIIVILMAVLCALLWINVRSSTLSEGEPASTGGRFFMDLLPGLAVIVIFIAVLETIGFYVSSALAFLAVAFLYEDDNQFEVKSFLKKVVITVLFMAVLYLLFWKGLHVRTPQGFLF